MRSSTRTKENLVLSSLLFRSQVADVVACCGTESVIREVTWGGSLHKEHVVRDVRLDANKQASCRLSPAVCLVFDPACFGRDCC